MQFDHGKILASPSERAKIDSTLDEYLVLHGSALTRLRFKRKGPARDSMVQALAQMAMLFAAANMGSQAEFDECLDDLVARAAADTPQMRLLRAFYLRNITRVPGTLGEAVGRLALARPRIVDAPVLDDSELAQGDVESE
jgi:hypothetical protein